MDIKLPRWEMSGDEKQTGAPILGKIKTELGGKFEGGHKSSETGQEKPGTHKQLYKRQRAEAKFGSKS